METEPPAVSRCPSDEAKVDGIASSAFFGESRTVALGMMETEPPAVSRCPSDEAKVDGIASSAFFGESRTVALGPVRPSSCHIIATV